MSRPSTALAIEVIDIPCLVLRLSVVVAHVLNAHLGQAQYLELLIDRVNIVLESLVLLVRRVECQLGLVHFNAWILSFGRGFGISIH